MGVIIVDFRKPKVREDVVAENVDLEIGYLRVLQALNIVLSNAVSGGRKLHRFGGGKLHTR